MSTELLSARDICVNYGAVRALDGVSIHVDEGEVVSVIGSNGAGKTTMMKTVAGLLASRSGVITFEDQDITDIEAQDLVSRGISLVPEGRQVFGRMSVEENLILGATAARAARSATTSRTASPSFPDSRSAGASGPGRCRAGSSRCSPSPAASCPGRGSCSWTSPPSASLRNW